MTLADIGQVLQSEGWVVTDSQGSCRDGGEVLIAAEPGRGRVIGLMVTPAGREPSGRVRAAFSGLDETLGVWMENVGDLKKAKQVLGAAAGEDAVEQAEFSRTVTL